VSVRRVILEERVVPGKRLGRHVEHDPRSRDHRFGLAVTPLVNITHKRHGDLFNQGDLGSCGGNAGVGATNTEPLFVAGRSKVLHEKQAVEVYSVATVLDGFPGQFPPDDTGTSGLAVGKALVQRGLIRAYHWAFGVDEALAALQIGPVITGIGWPEGFDNPDQNGVVTVSGEDRGGHEFVVRSYRKDHLDPLDSVVGADNSWGTSWGKRGHFYMTVRTWANRLEAQGDVTVLVP
jgi:hypothetical protein